MALFIVSMIDYSKVQIILKAIFVKLVDQSFQLTWTVKSLKTSLVMIQKTNFIFLKDQSAEFVEKKVMSEK